MVSRKSKVAYYTFIYADKENAFGELFRKNRGVKKEKAGTASSDAGI